ncbi:hypothetical protein C2U70_15950 [Bradyrhizobium guangdongense]|uniref:hypothetical protein n=1 Tax=Bradyrhizobium guangdongense TaxID=1325090 RepID=UPI00112966DD|nr:hypothetical protein [Bradyrhizobium guangdongense]TPQ34843.1 hypothetical protein C2U70_15950 [Bradyrhizobium guangdongense]
MKFNAQEMFNLLPAILRIRDRAQAQVTPGLLDPADRVTLADLLAKVAGGTPLTVSEAEQLDLLQNHALGGPLASLLAVFAEQVAVLQEDLDQLYDDQFIETCADWVVPYIGELVGSRALHGIAGIASPRADVAHTTANRRHKGTVPVIEQVARDVTGWDASAVEFFQRLIVTQYMNHIRPQCAATPDVRRWEPLERVGTAFDPIMRTIDVRRIAGRRGRYNIKNIGVFLWRLNAYPLSGSPAARLDARRWRFHPLGIDQPIYTHPATEDDITDLATPLNVPVPISRRVLATRPADYYTGADNIARSVRLYDDSSGTMQPIDIGKIRICNLSDSGANWAHLPPAGIYVIDPVLGRIAVPPGLPAGVQVRADFHYGFSADMGGGEYERAASFETAQTPPQLLRVPGDFASIQAALNALSGAGVVEITDSGRYAETLSINASADKRIELRAANNHRPTLILGGAMTLAGGARSEIRLNGLLISGAGLQVQAAGGNALRKLAISHCTLVPGLSLAADCTPVSPTQASLTVGALDLEVTIDHAITGSLRIDPVAQVSARDSIIDATATTGIAYAAPDAGTPPGPGAPLSLDACTVIGKIRALSLPLVSNSILIANTVTGDKWTAPVIAERRQEGCVRFSYVPLSARVPRRYQCLPESATRPELATPRFTSLRYGFAAYCQLARSSGERLLTGADDDAEPGAFHSLYQPQRETNLRIRLEEYVRVGLQSGIFYES